MISIVLLIKNKFMVNFFTFKTTQLPFLLHTIMGTHLKCFFQFIEQFIIGSQLRFWYMYGYNSKKTVYVHMQVLL